MELKIFNFQKNLRAKLKFLAPIIIENLQLPVKKTATSCSAHQFP